jgi:hypothetical protein
VSEYQPEPTGQSGGIFMKKYAGIPGIVWVAGAVLLAYLIFRRSGTGGGATSTGGGGTSTTGNISVGPVSRALNVTANYNNAHTSTTIHPAHHKPMPPRHRVPNPQPRPPHKRPKRIAVKHKHIGEPED